MIFVFACLPGSAANKIVIIEYDEGGEIALYNERWRQYESEGTLVIINGACISACARYMTLSNFCATDAGYFYLHGVTNASGRVDHEAGISDSKRWETPKALRLQQRYDSFAYGIEKTRPFIAKPVEPGVEIVYQPAEGGFYKLLKVKGTKLVPHCRSLPVR